MSALRHLPPFCLPAAALLALIGVWFRGLAFGESLFGVDFHLTFQPLRAVFGEQLRAVASDGWPAWNPHLSNGTPLAANPINAAFYPANWLLALWPGAYALSCITVVHVAFGGLGALSLARRLDLSRLAAWTSAIVFCFAGTSVSATAYLNLSWSAAWIPWLLVAERSLARGNTARGACGVVVSLASLILLGEPFALLAGLIGLTCFGTFSIEHLRKRRAIHAAQLAVCAAGALTLSFPATYSYLSYVDTSVRQAGFTWEGVTIWSLHPAHAIELLIPGAFGDASVAGARAGDGFWAQRLVPEKGHPLFLGIYVGGLALALAGLGLAQRRSQRTAILVWLTLLFVLSLGRFSPLYWMTASWPGFDALRFPVKWLVPASLPLGLASGFGVDRAMRLIGERRRGPVLVWILAVTAFVAGVSALATPALVEWLAGGSVTRGAGIDQRQMLLNGAIRAIVPLLAAIAVVAFVPQRRVVGSLLAGLVCLDLLLVTPAFAPTTDARFYADTPAAVEAIRDDPRGHGRVFVVTDPGPRAREFSSSFAERSRHQRDSLWGYAGIAYGLDLAFNVDTEAMSPLEYMQLKVLVDSAPLREKLMLLGAAGVTHVVAHTPLDSEWLEPLAVLDEHHDPPQHVYRNELALPAAYVVPHAIALNQDELVRELPRAPASFLASHVVVEPGTRSSIQQTHAVIPVRFESTTVTEIARSNRERRYRTSGAGGYLVISETLVPGWHARIDGEDVELLRANVAFQALALPAGEHDVVLRYDPWRASR